MVNLTEYFGLYDNGQLRPVMVKVEHSGFQDPEHYRILISRKIDPNLNSVSVNPDNNHRHDFESFEKRYFTGYDDRYQTFKIDRGDLLIEAKDRSQNSIRLVFFEIDNK